MPDKTIDTAPRDGRTIQLRYRDDGMWINAHWNRKAAGTTGSGSAALGRWEADVTWLDDQDADAWREMPHPPYPGRWPPPR